MKKKMKNVETLDHSYSQLVSTKGYNFKKIKNL